MKVALCELPRNHIYIYIWGGGGGGCPQTNNRMDGYHSVRPFVAPRSKKHAELGNFGGKRMPKIKGWLCFFSFWCEKLTTHARHPFGRRYLPACFGAIQITWESDRTHMTCALWCLCMVIFFNILCSFGQQIYWKWDCVCQFLSLHEVGQALCSRNQTEK